MMATPKSNYPYPSTYQPNEHVLPLNAAYLAEPIPHDDFVIDPK